MIVEARSDAELEAWTRVRNAVEVDAPGTVEDMQIASRHEPERRYLLALRDGEAVGCAFVSRSSVPGRGFALPRVDPRFRRRGVGNELLDECRAHVRTLGCDLVRSHVDATDSAGLAFAARHGFTEVDRQVELVRKLDGPVAPPILPTGVVLAELDPGHRDEVRELMRQGIEDMPAVGGIGPAALELMFEEATEATVAFVALAEGRVVGIAGLMPAGARERVLEHTLTTVARERRGLGLAIALKQSCVGWATKHGYRELVTWTQVGNDAMQAVNVRAGFRTGHVSLVVEGPVP